MPNSARSKPFFSLWYLQAFSTIKARTLGAATRINRVKFEYLAVQEQWEAEGLVLSGSGHVEVYGQVGEKGYDFRGDH